jgi:hypothetical protein
VKEETVSLGPCKKPPDKGCDDALGVFADMNKKHPDNDLIVYTAVFVGVKDEIEKIVCDPDIDADLDFIDYIDSWCDFGSKTRVKNKSTARKRGRNKKKSGGLQEEFYFY